MVIVSSRQPTPMWVYEVERVVRVSGSWIASVYRKFLDELSINTLYYYYTYIFLYLREGEIANLDFFSCRRFREFFYCFHL